VDYCIFDISTWNPNVALEIGLAEGLGVDYYILLNRRLKKMFLLISKAYNGSNTPA